MLPIKTILHATDFSEQAQHAFHYACELAEHFQAHVLVLHVAPPPTAACYEQVMLPDRLDFEEQLREKLCRIRPAQPHVLVEHCLAEGDAAAEIVRKVREVPCDLIVLGTHGRTGLSRLVLGSVAEHVVRTAPCPVLTVKLPAPAEAAEEPRGEEGPVAVTGSL